MSWDHQNNPINILTQRDKLIDTIKNYIEDYTVLLIFPSLLKNDKFEEKLKTLDEKLAELIRTENKRVSELIKLEEILSNVADDSKKYISKYDGNITNENTISKFIQFDNTASDTIGYASLENGEMTITINEFPVLFKKSPFDIYKIIKNSGGEAPILENIGYLCDGYRLQKDIDKINVSFDKANTKIKLIRGKGLVLNIDETQLLNKLDGIYSQFSNLQNDPQKNCKDIYKFVKEWASNENDRVADERRLTNIYEDKTGAVRVYIKIKPLDSNPELFTINGTSLTLTCGNSPKTYGPYYGIFPGEFKNLDTYTGVQNTEGELAANGGNVVNAKINDPAGAITKKEAEYGINSAHPGIKNVIEQVKSGYSVILFGYGLSGSGKTYTLLGQAGVPGLIHYALANLDATTITIKNIFEHYVEAISFGKTAGQGKASGKIISLYGDFGDRDKLFTKDQMSSITPNSISGVLNTIDTYRTGKGRVKPTPNNPNSSRSHLFIVFEITFGNGTVGYLTFCDTAGREEPKLLIKQFSSDANDNTISDAEVSRLLEGNISEGSVISNDKQKGIDYIIQKNLIGDKYKGSYTPENVYDIIREGMFINESINHLKWFFNIKSNKQIETPLQSTETEYKTEKFFVTPINEYISVSNIPQATIYKAEGKNARIISILNYLDKLSEDPQNPSKFIMMCMVRQEPQYCDQIGPTLDFADAIKST